MRFQRNVKIFRGGVDAAPFAGLFFVVVMFMLLLYSHVFIPGVPIRLMDEEAPPEVTPRAVKINAGGGIDFFGRSLDFTQLKREIEARLQKGTMPRRVIVEAETTAAPALVDQIEDLLEASGVAIKYPGSRLELPEDAGFTGAHAPVVVVGVNLNGQIFFEHQLIQEAALQRKLELVREKAGEPVTMILQADAKVPADKITRLAAIARRAEISQLFIATRPPRG